MINTKENKETIIKEAKKEIKEQLSSYRQLLVSVAIICATPFTVLGDVALVCTFLSALITAIMGYNAGRSITQNNFNISLVIGIIAIVLLITNKIVLKMSVKVLRRDEDTIIMHGLRKHGLYDTLSKNEIEGITYTLKYGKEKDSKESVNE